MARALQADQAVITQKGLRYIDNEHGEEKIVPFSEIIDLPEEEIPNAELPEETSTSE